MKFVNIKERLLTFLIVSKKSDEQDFKIKTCDINFISLGPEIRFRSFNKKIIINHLIKTNKIEYDLLVRGITHIKI